MNKIKESYKEFEEKHPLFAIPLAAALLVFAITVVAALVLYLVVSGMGMYESLETALDLKVNSPTVLVPLVSAAALAVLCGMSAVLMFFHKYKRPKINSDFFNALAPVLGMEKGKKG